MIVVKNKILPFAGFKALTVFPFVFVRGKASLSAIDENHERIHGAQQAEVLPLAVVVTMVLLLVGCGWWSLLAMPLYLWWYVGEFVVRFFCKGNAYRNISFEREAYGNQSNAHYLADRDWFAWVEYIKEK